MSLRDDLIRDEGIRLKPYRDSLNVLSIGIGRNLDDVGITEAEALALLDNDIARVYADLDRELAWWRGRPEWVQRGLGSMCFQLGITGLLGFKRMLACIHAGDYRGAQAEGAASLWAKQTPTRANRVIALFSDKPPDGLGGSDGIQNA